MNYQRPTVSLKCLHCGCDFTTRLFESELRLGRRGKYCSRECNGAALRKPDAKANHAAAKRAYELSHPDRRTAYQRVRRWVQRGALERKPCEVCGSDRVHAHHHDYGRPLDVRWLCPKHHKEAHRATA